MVDGENGKRPAELLPDDPFDVPGKAHVLQPQAALDEGLRFHALDPFHEQSRQGVLRKLWIGVETGG